MVLDDTRDLEEEKKPINREAIITTVPEYAEEIYKHLREAEVSLVQLGMEYQITRRILLSDKRPHSPI